jgi:hypothetical protein
VRLGSRRSSRAQRGRYAGAARVATLRHSAAPRTRGAR